MLPLPDSESEAKVTAATGAAPTELMIALFPSPADQVLHIIRPENAGAASLTICNVLGQFVWQQVDSTLPETQLDLSRWPGGLYYLSVASKGQQVWQKAFIVQH